ncbi:type II secretion system protein M [Thaumasiovibrio subtropicus]|uniref:type II secretion system protein M n=1 Tax=Thaumasiovibrio subtropicus TaxID=1891207 RepID=UPI000B35FA2B|nr:type II secretion system protein M [Thaumasiovibrio subtropicus]
MKQWWSSISEREQRLVLGMGLVLVVGILYWGIWQPVTERATSAENNVSSQRNQLTWVQEKANQIIANRGQGGASTFSDKGLSQVVNETARRYKVSVIRMQPRNEELQVWIQPLAYNDLLNWLAHLREVHGIDAQFLDINRGERNGLIEVNRLQLGRN